MATITAGEFRNGVTFEMDGKVMQVVEFQHVKPGKGAAFVRTKMRDVLGGGVTETSFNPTAKFESAYIERKDAEYSYNDGDLYYFMDQESYEMVPVSKGDLPDGFAFVKEKKPGVFIRLGSHTPGGAYGSAHSPTYYSDPRSIPTGMLTIIGLAADFLGFEVE